MNPLPEPPSPLTPRGVIRSISSLTRTTKPRTHVTFAPIVTLSSTSRRDNLTATQNNIPRPTAHACIWPAHHSYIQLAAKTINYPRNRELSLKSLNDTRPQSYLWPRAPFYLRAAARNVNRNLTRAIGAPQTPHIVRSRSRPLTPSYLQAAAETINLPPPHSRERPASSNLH